MEMPVENDAPMPKAVLPLLTGLLFAGSFIAGEYTTADLGPLTTSFLRYVVALMFLSGLFCSFGFSSLRIEVQDIAWFAALGLTGIVCYHYFFFQALRYTEVANTAIINALSPILTAFMATLFLREKLSRWNYAGLVLAFAGVVVLLARGDAGNLLRMKFAAGDLLMLCSVLSWVVYALLIKRLSARYSAFTITFYATAFGVALLIVLAVQEGLPSQVYSMSMRSLYSVIYMGVFASGLGYLLYNGSIARIGPTRTSTIVYSSVPVFVALLSWLLLDEPVTWVIMLSTGMILAGLHATLRQR